MSQIKKKIVIFDASMVSAQPNGISSDSRQILSGLRAMPIDVLPIRFSDQVALDPMTFHLKASRKFSNLRHILGMSTKVNVTGDVFFQSQLNSLQPMKEVLTLVRVHDLFPYTHPEWFKLRSRLAFNRRLQTISRSTYFLCNSNYTAAELLRLNRFDETRIFVLPCVPDISHVDACGNCSGCVYGGTKNFGVAIGTIEPRKNYSFLVQAWEELGNQTRDSELLIVGRYGWRQRRVLQQLENSSSKNLVWMKDVCDAGVQRLLSQAKFFVSTSLDEGFNIPASHACTNGCLLLLSDINVHHELHPNSEFFSLDSTEELKRKILEILRSNASKSPIQTCRNSHPAFTTKEFRGQLESILMKVGTK